MPEGKRVLIVDDNPDACDFCEAMLAEVGPLYTLKETDGATALELARGGKPDLICLDVQMPGMSGFEVFKALRSDEDLKSVPVIMITGVGNEVGVHFTADEVGNMLGTKPEGYLEKPVDAIQLQKLAGALLGMGEEGREAEAAEPENEAPEEEAREKAD